MRFADARPEKRTSCSRSFPRKRESSDDVSRKAGSPLSRGRAEDVTPVTAPAVTANLSDWERHLTLPDGQTVHIRPIRPEDEALYAPFVAAVTPDDSRLRFFAPLKELSRERVAAFTHLDYAHAMAFIALDETSGEMLGVARRHDIGGDAGEYAIIVRSDLKSHGLGWQLMQLMIAYARAHSLRAIEGRVLHENNAMLDMCRQLGFALENDPKDASICVVRLKL